MENWGFSYNKSMVRDDDGWTGGVNYTSTDGIEANAEIKADSLEDAERQLEEAIRKVINKQIAETDSLPDAEVDNQVHHLEVENEQLRDEVAFLRERYEGVLQVIEQMNKDFDEVCDENDMLWEELEAREDNELIEITLKLDPKLLDLDSFTPFMGKSWLL